MDLLTSWHCAGKGHSSHHLISNKLKLLGSIFFLLWLRIEVELKAMCCWNVYCVGLAFLWMCVNLNVVRSANRQLLHPAVLYCTVLYCTVFRSPDRQLLHPAGPAPLLAPGHPLQALPLPLRLHRPAQRHQVCHMLSTLLKVSTKFHEIF